MKRKGWMPVVDYCPSCGEHTLYRHDHWNDGSVREIPYARCSSCGQGFFIDVLDEDDDYYKECDDDRK